MTLSTETKRLLFFCVVSLGIIILIAVFALGKKGGDTYKAPVRLLVEPSNKQVKQAPWKPSYTELEDTYSKDNTDKWEITPAKKCCSGPYTWGNKNSETYKYCSDPKNQAAINRYCCTRKGFNGAPLHFDYTVESDANWNNPRCSTPMSKNLMPPIL